MAGATQHQSRGSVINTPSASSEDGTFADTPIDGADLQQHGGAPTTGSARETATAHDEVAPLGANVVEALKIVSRLEQLALDKQEIALPKCIVLGQQSAGKSSVIEAISGIKTPRDTGTCTRAPLFIELRPSADAQAHWHAEISLLRQYDFLTDMRHRGLDTEFPNWIPAAAPGPTPFAQTDDPNQLENLIRCAQRATLSPLENPESFLNPAFDDHDIHKTLFSPNIVCIVISKPGLPPLSFYDLPGLIHQAETDEEEYTVPLVKALVTKYVKDPDALVLVTCALEVDIATSDAAGLARRLGVADRCLGVLTKPDRLPPGTRSSDLSTILDNRRFAMGHEYFVVKNLNSDEITQGFTHSQARTMEQEFFSTVPPWSTDLYPYHARFGTFNLQRYISSQLGNRVMQKLPGIHRQIHDRLAAVEEELSRIPDTPLHTAQRTVADVLQAFAAEVRSEMAGDFGHVSWNITWREVQKALWDNLVKMKPTMSTTGDLDRGLFASTLPGRSSDDSIVIDSDDDMEPETPTKKRKHDTTTKRESQTPAPTSSPFRTPKKPATSRNLFPNAPTASQTDNLAKLKKPFKLDEITRHIAQTSRSRVPGQIDPQVREEMMMAPLQHWPAITDAFFKEFDCQLKLRIHALFGKHFQEGSELYTASLAIIKTIIDNNLHEQRHTMAAESLNDEQEGPHIFHEDIFKREKAIVMERYTQARFDARLKVYLAEYAAHYDREMSSVDKKKLREDDRRMTLLQEEPYSHEIGLVADISTHYMIAARRFHDSITMRIESKFFKQLRDKLRDQLQDELGIYDEYQGPQIAQRLLAESPERLTRRNILVAKRKALIEGLQCFNEHYQKCQAQNAGLPASAASYQRPSVASPTVEEMEDVSSHGLPLRSMSRPAI